VLDFLKLVIDADGQFHIDRDDEIVRATLMCSAGELLRK
jgi:NAD(P) transhydrogenase subunit alpha